MSDMALVTFPVFWTLRIRRRMSLTLGIYICPIGLAPRVRDLIAPTFAITGFRAEEVGAESGKLITCVYALRALAN